MRLAGEVYEAAVVPRPPLGPAGRAVAWLRNKASFGDDSGNADPVVADIVVIDLRNGAERVDISVTGAQVSTTLAKLHRDLDSMSVSSFDERWGVV